MSGLFIGVKRIIAVDSSDFAYAELDIDKHCMLVAEGNVGKSSLINAIRLFFLPECSMAKQAINFGFSDSQGEHYSSEASFQHYFPSKYSFLILEYEKRLFDGEHSCQILSMAAGRLKFERMFTSLPYEQIRHLFWEEGDDADGIGKRVDGLSKQSVYAFIQAQDKHAVLAKEASKVASLIYESELAATRFTLFPLNNIDEQQVNSLRALIKLLFVASSRNKKPFTSAIAHIIESGKKHSQDQLGFSIAEFKAKHESLKTEENKLNAITNWQGKFDKLRKHKKDFLDYLAILGQVEPAKAWLETGLGKLRVELQTHADKVAGAQQKLTQAKTKLRKAEDDEKAFSRESKTANKELNEQLTKQKRLHELAIEYANQGNDYIAGALNDEINDKQSLLEMLGGKLKRDEVLASLDIKIEKAKAQISVLERAINSEQFNLDKQVSKQAITLLQSLNPLLSSANTNVELETEAKKCVEAFAELFEEGDTHYQFFDQHIPIRPFTAIDKAQALEKAQQELHSLEKQRKQSAQDFSNPIQQDHAKKEIEKALTLAQNDKSLIDDTNYIERRIADLNTQTSLLIEQLAANEKLKQASVKAFDDAQSQYNKFENEYQDCKRRLDELNQLKAQVDRFITTYSHWLRLCDKDEPFNGYLNSSQLDMIEQSAQQLQSLQNTIQNGLRDYIEARVISDKHGLKGDSPFWHEIAACFNDVEEVYGNLEMQRHLLGKQIEEHNQTIGNKREVIIQNYRLIKSFEHEINEAFAGITINNIEKVEFTVGINRQFDSLVKEFEHTNLFAQEMQSDAFYTRLVAFAERFFDEDDNFVLSMDKVIESFEPKVKVRNKTSTEDKKQSNSTNALIKIKLVQLLLNRLIAHKTQTAFPIVHDEIANIDIGQFDWWLQDLSAAGFSLVAAGTHSTSPELQAKIGRRHVLDAMTSAQAYHQERNRVYWQGAEEFVSVAEPQIQADLV